MENIITLNQIRKKTLEKIINSTDDASLESEINNCVEKLRAHNINGFLIVRLLSKLELSLQELKRNTHNPKTSDNIKKAINILHNSTLNHTQQKQLNK